MPWSVWENGESPRQFCVVKSGTTTPIPGGCHKTKADAEAHLRALYANEPQARTSGIVARFTQPRTAAMSDGFPLDPPREWFEEMPDWFEPGMKFSVISQGPEAGRVAATVAARGTFILDGTGGRWQSPPSPSNYSEAMQGDTYCADGSVVRTANLAMDTPHVHKWASYREAVDIMAHTGAAVARVRYMDVDGYTVALGSAWPGLSDITIRKMQASGLSGDWRWREEYGGYDCAGAIFVNNGALPLPDRPIFQPMAMAASLDLEHPPILGSWICDENGVCSMPIDQEPVLTLTLTASETARLHALLTGPQTAAVAPACTCGAHTAAGPPPMADTNTPPSQTQVPDANAGAPTREEVDALTARVEALEQAAVDAELAEVDSYMASMTLPEPFVGSTTVPVDV